MVKAFLNNAIGSTFKENQHSYWKQCFLLKNTLQSLTRSEKSIEQFPTWKRSLISFPQTKNSNIENGEFASIVNH